MAGWRSGLWSVLLCVGLSLAACDDSDGETPVEDTAPPNDTGVMDTEPDLEDVPVDTEDAPNDTSDDVDDADDVDMGPVVPELEPRPVAGRWFAGDFHVHATGASNDAGDESTPEHIKEVAQMRGLDFIVLTDHSNSTGSDPSTLDEDPALFNQGPEFPYWNKAAELSDATFLMIDGNEISPRAVGDNEPNGHIGCYPRDLDTFDPDIAFTDRPRGEVTGAMVLQQALDAGCFTTVNHPFAQAPWIAWDWTSYDYDALEVFNGTAGWDTADYQAAQAWACDLAQGRRVLAIGGSDNHRADDPAPAMLLDPPLAWPTTWVWAESLDWSQLVASLDAGRVTISDSGAPLDLDIYDADGGWLAMTGGEFQATEARWMRVRGEIKNNGASGRKLDLFGIAPGSCNDLRQVGTLEVPEANWVQVHRETVTEGPFEVVFELEATPGWAYFVLVHPGFDTALLANGIGLSNAVWAN